MDYSLTPEQKQELIKQVETAGQSYVGKPNNKENIEELKKFLMKK